MQIEYENKNYQSIENIYSEFNLKFVIPSCEDKRGISIKFNAVVFDLAWLVAETGFVFGRVVGAVFVFGLVGLDLVFVVVVVFVDLADLP